MNVFIKSYFFVTAAVVLHGAYKGWFCLSQTLEGQGEGGGKCPLLPLPPPGTENGDFGHPNKHTSSRGYIYRYALFS